MPVARDAAACGLLISDNAVALRRDPSLLPRLERIMAPRGLAVRTSRAEDAHAAIEQLRRQGIELLCVCGGDGTISSTLTAAVQVYGKDPLPKVGLIRGGTINTLANYLKVKGRPDRLLREIIAHRGLDEPLRTKKLSSIQINSSIGFTFGAAMVGRFYHEYNQLPSVNRLTVTRFVLGVTLSALFNTARARRMLTRTQATIEADGQELPLRAFSVIVASCLEDHGFGAKPTYRGESQPGCFQLVASGKPSRAIVREYHRLLRGLPFSARDHFDSMVEEATIRFARPDLCMIDGEVFREQLVRLRTGPTIELVVL
jgi:diacylglycerol kinase family enzyme